MRPIDADALTNIIKEHYTKDDSPKFTRLIGKELIVIVEAMPTIKDEPKLDDFMREEVRR